MISSLGMFKNIKIENFIFSLVFLLFSVAILAEILNHNFETVDFKVYYTAATNLIEHKPIYEFNTTNHFVFKYSPYFAFLCIPFTYLNYPSSQLVYLFIIAFIFSWSLIILCRDLQITSRFLIFFILIVFLKHIQKEVYLGQINTLVFSLLVFTIHSLIKNKPILAALNFSIALIVKPVGLFIFPFLLFKDKFKFSSYLILILLTLTLVIYLLIYNDNSLYITEIKSWFIELQIELQKKDILNLDNCRLESFIHKSFGISAIISKIVALSIIGILIGTFFYFFAFPQSYYLILALTPLLLSTSNNFYLFSIPIFMVVFRGYSSYNYNTKFSVIIMGILMGGNLYDIWGRKGVDMIDSYVPYSIALLMACILLIVNKFNLNKKILDK